MQTKELTYIDRSNWRSGPWDDEPDKIQFQDEETGLPCLGVRSPNFGHWCGYVGVSEGHPLFGINYDTCSLKQCESYCEHSPSSMLSVHGGITFTGFCVEDNKERGICHTTDPGEPERVFWHGFDCCHCDDVSPTKRVMRLPGTTYKTLDYVKQECRYLAKQLAEMKND